MIASWCCESAKHPRCLRPHFASRPTAQGRRQRGTDCIVRHCTRSCGMACFFHTRFMGTMWTSLTTSSTPAGLDATRVCQLFHTVLAANLRTVSRSQEMTHHICRPHTIGSIGARHGSASSAWRWRHIRLSCHGQHTHGGTAALWRYTRPTPTGATDDTAEQQPVGPCVLFVVVYFCISVRRCSRC